MVSSGQHLGLSFSKHSRIFFFSEYFHYKTIIHENCLKKLKWQIPGEPLRPGIIDAAARYRAAARRVRNTVLEFLYNRHEGGEVVSPTHRNIARTEETVTCQYISIFYNFSLCMTSHSIYRSLVICIREFFFSSCFFELLRWLIRYTTTYRGFLSEVYFT